MPNHDESIGRAPVIAIAVVHITTGALFLLFNGILYWALLPGHWLIALAYDPFFAFCCWGWYAEARALWRGRDGNPQPYFS